MNDLTRTFDFLNGAGKGVDPTDEINGWTLVRRASTTDVELDSPVGPRVLAPSDAEFGTIPLTRHGAP